MPCSPMMTSSMLFGTFLFSFASCIIRFTSLDPVTHSSASHVFHSCALSAHSIRTSHPVVPSPLLGILRAASTRFTSYISGGVLISSTAARPSCTHCHHLARARAHLCSSSSAMTLSNAFLSAAVQSPGNLAIASFHVIHRPLRCVTSRHSRTPRAASLRVPSVNSHPLPTVRTCAHTVPPARRPTRTLHGPVESARHSALPSSSYNGGPCSPSSHAPSLALMVLLRSPTSLILTPACSLSLSHASMTISSLRTSLRCVGCHSSILPLSVHPSRRYVARMCACMATWAGVSSALRSTRSISSAKAAALLCFVCVWPSPPALALAYTCAAGMPAAIPRSRRTCLRAASMALHVSSPMAVARA